MKIAIINKHCEDDIGGSEIQCDFIANELFTRGHKVTYITPGGKKADYNRSYEVLPSELSGQGICDQIHASEPDVIYWRFNKNFFFRVVKWAKKHRIPFIFAASHISDLDPWFYKKRAGIRKKVKYLINSHLNHLGFTYIDALTVNNQEFLGRLNVARQYYIPNGISRARKPFLWERPYCAWVGSLKQVKRPEMVVELAKAFGHKEIDFIMVGKVQEEAYNWLLENNLPPNLLYVGEKSFEEVNGILNQAQMHIHTCYPEGFPNVFIQSWIQGTPSVSLGFDPNGLIEEHQMGFYAHDDWDEFKSRIELLLENPDERERMGRNAEKFAGDKFLIEKTVDKLEEVIYSLA